MPRELDVRDVDAALRLVLDRFSEDSYEDLERIKFGHWATTKVDIEGNFHSELNGAFLSAYSRINDDLLRLFAQSRYGSADIRLLKQEDLSYFEFRVKVKEGSSDVSDNLWSLLEKLSVELVGKMTGHELVIVVVGLGLLASSYFGMMGYLQNRKEVRLEEIQSEERRASIAAMEFASSTQKEQFKEIVALMRDQNAVSARAVDAAMTTNEELIKAISKTGDVEIGGNLITKADAKELLAAPRRKSTVRIVEQDMKVVDVNTSDPNQTTVILEDPSSGGQYKVSFRDRLVDANYRVILIKKLEERGTAWFRLSTKVVGDDVTSVEILSVSEHQPEP